MIDPNVQLVNNIPQTDNTSDVAGGASVVPSYIASDVQTAPDVNVSIGIDSVAVSTGVSSSQVSLGGPVEKDESSNYIQSDVDTTLQASEYDQFEYDMNSIARVELSDQYIEPNASGVQEILADLKSSGTITSGMSDTDVVLAINNYVFNHYTYIADTGDTWNSVAQTIKTGGGDCEDFANLAASLMCAALIDRGESLDDVNKKIGCVVIANKDTGIGHVVVEYAQNDGSKIYLDPVSKGVSRSLDSTKDVVFSYNLENVNVIDKGFDLSRLNTEDETLITIPQDNGPYIEVNPGDFDNYWTSVLGMEQSASTKNAIGIYESLADLITAVITKYGSWAASPAGQAGYDTIETLLGKLDKTSILDYASVVSPFWGSYDAILTELGVSSTAYNTDFLAFNTTMITYLTTYCMDSKTYKGWKSGTTDMNGVADDLVAIEYLKNGVSTLDQFKAAHPDQLIKTPADPKKGTAEVDYTDDEILDDVYFKNPSGGNVCTVRQGLAAIQSYVSYVAAKNEYNYMYTAWFGRSHVSEYCGYSQTYKNSFTTTTNYMDSMLSFLDQAEYGVWKLNKEVVQIDSTVELINDQAVLDDATTAYKAAAAKFDWDADPKAACVQFYTDVKTYMGGAFASIDTQTDVTKRNQMISDCFESFDSRYESEHQIIFSDILGDEGYTVETFEGWFTTYLNMVWAKATMDTAQKANDTARTNYKGFYNVASDADLDQIMDDYKAKYLSQDTNGWWEINVDAKLFSELISEASLMKGYLTALSLIYEAKRDMRGLVQQELDGENYSLKGMAINTLFMKKVNKVDQYIQQTIVDILTSIDSLNQAKYDQEISDINSKYDKKAADIKQADANPGLCQDDNTEEDLLKNDNARMNETDAVSKQYDDVKKKQLLVVKSLLQATGMNITGNTSDEIWSSINKQINNVLDNTDNFSRNTLNTSDDSQYREVDTNLVTSMRQSLTAVFGIERTILMAKQAISDMRNLAHQEMTGIGGRQSKMDVAAQIVASDSNAVMSMFDEMVSDVETITKLGNQIRYDQIQIEKNNKMIEKIDSQKSKRIWAKVLEGIAFVASVVAYFVPGPWSVVLIAVAIAAGTVASILNSSANKEVADERYNLENEYKYQVIKPTDPVFEKKIDSMSGLTDEQKKEILQNYDPNEGTFSGNLNKIGGLTDAQKNEILNAYDPNRESFMNSINSNTTLTASQKEAIKNAYDPNEATFKSNLSKLGLSADQQNAILNTYDPKRAAFMKNIDSLNLTDAQKQALKNAYDPNEETFKNNLAGIGGLNTDMRNAIINDYEENSFIVSINSMSTLTAAQKLAIKNAYDPNSGTFSTNLNNIDGLTQSQKNAILNAYNMTPVSTNNNTIQYSSDPVINAALNADNSNSNMYDNMTGANYLTFMNDGHPGDYAGSSAFNTVKFANTLTAISVENLILMVAEAIRETMVEMRNLVHEEMTSIGGRAPSSMVTATMEAARGQQAFIANEMYMKISDMNTANNLRFQSDQKLRLYKQIADAADISFGLSFIPIVGSLISDTYSNLANLMDQKDQLEETNKANFETETNLDDPELNGLVDDGLIDTGNGTVGVNYQKVSDTRSAVAKEFIKDSVESTIRQTMRELRSITHMEMTNIQSSTGANFADQANTINFQTAMETISLITQYLSQKAEIQNRVSEANQQISKLNKQITNVEIGAGVSLVVGTLISIFMPGGFDSVMAALNTLQLSSSVSSFVLSIFTTMNAWVEAKFASQMAKDDMGAIGEYLEMKSISDESVNSTTNRLEALQEKSVNEINANLLQDLGSGYIGVNKALSSEFKTLIDQLYKTEKKKSEIQQTLQSLRNSVNEIMTGISGVSTNATFAVLNSKEAEVKGRIDDMFSKLEEAANRWNEITDAQRSAKTAEMQAIMSTITTAIQGIIVAISLYNAFKLEPAANNKIKAAENEVQNAKTPEEKVAAQENLDAAKLEFKGLQNRISLYTSVILPASEIMVKLAFAFIEKAEMQDVQKDREKDVSQASGKKEGITKNAKDVSFTVKQAVANAGLNGYVARSEAVAGQHEVDDKAATYALKSEEIETDFKRSLYNVEMETVEFGKGIAKELIKMALDKPIEVYSPTETFAERLESVSGLTKAQKDAMKQAFNSDNAEQFSKQIETMSGLNTAQAEAVKEAYDKSKNIAKLSSFTERMSASASLATLTKEQNETIMQANKDNPDIQSFMEAVNSSPTLKDLSTTQKNALIDARDPKVRSFISKIDDMTMLTQAQKESIKKAYDPNSKAFINNMINLKVVTADASTPVNTQKPTDIQMATNTQKLTEAQILTVVQEYNPKIKAMMNILDTMVSGAAKLTDSQKISIIKSYDVNEATFNKNIESVKDLPVQKKDIAQAYKMAVKENVEVTTLSVSEQIELMKGLDPSIKSKMVKTVKKAEDLSGKAKAEIEKTKQQSSSAQAVAAGAGQQGQVQSASTPNLAPQEKQSANTSGSMARLDAIINQVAKAMDGLNDVNNQAESLKAQAAEKMDPKELLKVLQQQLKDAGMKIANEKKAIEVLKQDVLKTQGALASQEESVQKERNKLITDTGSVEKKMQELLALAKEHPESKDIIEQQVNSLKNQFTAMTKSYDELVKVKYELAKADSKILHQEIKNHEDNAAKFTAEVGGLKADIQRIQKEITLAKNGGVDKKITNGINAKTSMILGTGEAPKTKATQYA
jgi:Transglutaminase-like superfamily